MIFNFVLHFEVCHKSAGTNLDHEKNIEVPESNLFLYIHVNLT